MSKSDKLIGNNSLDMLSINRLLLMCLLYKNSNMPRTSLPQKTGLTIAAVSKRMNSLISIGILEKSGYVKGGLERRAIGLKVKTADMIVFAVQISRRKASYGKFGLSEKLLFAEVENLDNNKDMELLVDRIHEQIEFEPINDSLKSIFDRAYHGDELAFNLTKSVDRYIGYGVLNFINAYDSSEIITGDEMEKGGELILQEVSQVVFERIESRLSHLVNLRLEDQNMTMYYMVLWELQSVTV